MKYRLLFALLAFALIVAGVYISTQGSSLSDPETVGLIIAPLTITLLPGIVLPRRWAMIWYSAIILLAIAAAAYVMYDLQQCHGDGCIGHLLVVIFILAPIAAVSALLVLLRFLVKPKT